jgi:hypothetical protein
LECGGVLDLALCIFSLLRVQCSFFDFSSRNSLQCIVQHFVECAPFPMIGLDLAGQIKGFLLSPADLLLSSGPSYVCVCLSEESVLASPASPAASAKMIAETSSPPIPSSRFLHHPLSHLTRMYLHTDFNKSAEILLKLSKEQVMGKEFALIDIIDFDREKVFLRKSLCAFLI